MKNLVLLLSVLLGGCTPDSKDPEETSQCIIGLNAHLCFPESHMQVVYEIENTTEYQILLGDPLASSVPGYYPEGEGVIPHGKIELNHLDNGYFPVPGNQTNRYFHSSRMDKEPPGQFSASMLFTGDVLECLNENAYEQSPFTDEITYNLSPDTTLTCSEEQLISLLINYYRVTENNFDSLSAPEAGRPFTLTFTEETIPFEEWEGTYRRVTYHYKVLQSQ